MDAQSLSDGIYAKALEMRSNVDAAMSRLESAATLPYLSWFTLPAPTVFEPQKAKTITLGDLPTLEKVTIPSSANLTIDMMDAYKSKVWRSPELQSLYDMMMEYIETGGTGINQEVEDAIYNRGRERALQTLSDKMDLAGARTGARGGRYPNSMTKALQKVALTEYGDDKADLNRDIIKLMSELAQKNTQFATGAAIDIEKAYMDFSKAFPAIILDIKRGILDKFRIEQDAFCSEFDAQMQVIATNLDVELKNSTLEEGYQDRLQRNSDKAADMQLARGQAQVAQAEHANNIRLSAVASLVQAAIGLMQNMQASAISLVSRED